MTKKEFLKKINQTEVSLELLGQELVRINDGDPDCEGWEVRYIDKTSSIGLGCRCSESGTLHSKL